MNRILSAYSAYYIMVREYYGIWVKVIYNNMCCMILKNANNIVIREYQFYKEY